MKTTTKKCVSTLVSRQLIITFPFSDLQQKHELFCMPELLLIFLGVDSWSLESVWAWLFHMSVLSVLFHSCRVHLFSSTYAFNIVDFPEWVLMQSSNPSLSVCVLKNVWGQKIICDRFMFLLEAIKFWVNCALFINIIII